MKLKIIDMILHKNKYGTQTFVVLNRSPNFLYQRKQNLLIAEDSGFFSFYKYERPSEMFQAFAGRKFEIPLENGEKIQASGQWWDVVPKEYYDLLYQVGSATIDNLNNCYVFSSSYVDKKLIDDYLENNDPSNNYYKYCKRDKSYMEHKVVTKWDKLEA